MSISVLWKGEIMFTLKDKVMDKNGKIFTIVSIEQKDFGVGGEDYFVLEPCFRYDFNPGYMAYIPVAKSENLLKTIMTKEEAVELVSQIPDLEPLPEVAPRERRVYFTKVISSGDRKEIMRVIKTLVTYREERRKMNKPFSDYDRRLLDSLKMMVDNELSISLGISPDSVGSYILEKTGYVL